MAYRVLPARTAGKFATLPSFARVISLPGEDARWEQVVVELGAMGLEARRAVAVTPSELSASKLLRVRPVGAGGEPFGPKELACGMSHLKAWREIADGDEPYGLMCDRLLPKVLRLQKSGRVYSDYEANAIQLELGLGV